MVDEKDVKEDATSKEEAAEEVVEEIIEDEIVLVDKKQLESFKSKIVKRKSFVETPELIFLLDKENEGKKIGFEVQQMGLAEFVATKESNAEYARNLVEGVLAATIDSREVEEEIKAIMKKTPVQAKERIAIVQIGVLQPKLNESTWIYLAEYFPMVVQRLSMKILDLTYAGGELKKNS